MLTWFPRLNKKTLSMKEAHIKFGEALKYAPKWKQLKEARDAAARLKT